MDFLEYLENSQEILVEVPPKDSPIVLPDIHPGIDLDLFKTMFW